jgi:hypothetical protein
LRRFVRVASFIKPPDIHLLIERLNRRDEMRNMGITLPQDANGRFVAVILEPPVCIFERSLTNASELLHFA